MEETVDYYEYQRESFNDQESKHFEEIIPALRDLIVAIDQCMERLGKKEKGSELLDMVQNLVQKCAGIRVLVDSVHLPLPKSQFFEWTDAGPGVSVSNYDVKLRIAQRIRILNMDYYIRHHLAPGDSSQNEVERAQSFIADGLCDGGSLQWEYKKMFDGLSDEELGELSPNDIEELELKIMKFNAIKVCEEVSHRLDGAPGPGGYLKSFVTDSIDKLFFFDKEYVDEYLSKPKNTIGPGYHYYQRLERFLESHCRKGEKFLEFVKFECQSKTEGVKCDFCDGKDWVGPHVTYVPAPMPDESKLPEFHYLHVRDTPLEVDGKFREVDDFQPRVQIKKSLTDGSMSLQNEESISQFCNKFIVERPLLLKCVEHIQINDIKKAKRMQQRKADSTAETSKQYDDFDWVFLKDRDEIKKLNVGSLNKYIIHHNITCIMKFKKKQKVQVIENHIAAQQLLNGHWYQCSRPYSRTAN